MESHILIVDDDAFIRDSMSQYFSAAGYRSFLSSTAEEAVEALKLNTIDVVVTDIMLPGMNGLELTDLVKKEFDSDVIVMTGYSGDYSYEEAVNKGASDFVFKPFRFEELLLRLKRVLKERQLTRERMEMLEKLQKLAITDGLTNLNNSRYFFSQLELEMDRSRRYKHCLSLMLMDIDHFKQYNDTFGHLEGDKVLIRFGQVIRSCLRKMDSAYRYGGEEFTVILPETSGSEAVIVAERIRKAAETEKFLPLPGKIANTTVSIGVTEFRIGEEMSAFIHRSDKAMYQSKQTGRNRVSFLFADQTV